MKKAVQLTINGKSYSLEIPTHKTLLDVLREEIALTGSKEGCGVGDCGACTVLWGGKPVNSCLLLAVNAEGREIITIEGLARNGELDALQKAFVEHGAAQCGFCIPGIIMSARAMLNTNPNPSPLDIERSISGNLCRCTGYTKILEAIADAARVEASRRQPAATRR